MMIYQQCIQVNPPGHIITAPYDQYVWIHSSQFKSIFGKDRLRSGDHNCVKITNGKRSIYRYIETAGYTGITHSCIGLSYNSLCDLGIKLNKTSQNQINIKISPVNVLDFMLHHPDKSQKVPFLTSIITFLIGLILGYTF